METITNEELLRDVTPNPTILNQALNASQANSDDEYSEFNECTNRMLLATIFILTAATLLFGFLALWLITLY